MDDGGSVERQIAAWSENRPSWQRAVLRRLAGGRRPTQAELETIVDNLIAGKEEDVDPLNEAEISSAASEDSVTITLESIGGITNVNGLIEGETLTFGSDGLTVVYGKNASGKSGYARLIKAVSGALHVEPVHGNVFNESGELRAIRFYDEACGTRYITRESELTYRPSALALLDGLIDACGDIGSILDRRLLENEKSRGRLPTPPDESEAATFLELLTSSNTKQEVDDACRLPNDADEQLRTLQEEELRLRKTDPGEERKRLVALAGRAETLARHIEKIAEALSDTAVANATKARDEAVSLRDAAELASSQKFSDEPVAGVGTETWRAMWEAAREFSEIEAYHAHEFPVTGDGTRCVLCHQTLSGGASSRLTRFEAFVQDQTATRAAEAESAFETISGNLGSLIVKPVDVAEELVKLKDDKPKLGRGAAKWLKAAEKRRKAVVARIVENADDELPTLGSDVRGTLDAYAEKQRKAAEKIDATQFDENLATLSQKKIDLEGRITVSKKKLAIVAEVVRLKKRDEIEVAKRETDTGPITRQASTIMNRNVTADVLERFRAEAQGMRLFQVELTATGGKKGKFRQRPALADTDTGTPVNQVLSEGEQTALGLAGFFTEAHFDTSRSTVVFDDPVTSLDHVRRARVADRIVEFAKQRQVLVFTHELAFVVDLTTASKREGLVRTERRIERIGNTAPGKVGDSYPWDGKDIGTRFNALEVELSRIKKKRPDSTDEEYGEACANWAGRLSQIWEQIVHYEVVHQVFDTATFRVRPLNFRVLASITPEDDAEFQDSYGRCSLWAPRHDKSPEINYTPPEPDELEEELKRVRAWQKRIKSYR
jgi:ABC-type hemin transport system ATPase subunit